MPLPDRSAFARPTVPGPPALITKTVDTSQILRVHGDDHQGAGLGEGRARRRDRGNKRSGQAAAAHRTVP
jgi:hypothetical protein